MSRNSTTAILKICCLAALAVSAFMLGVGQSALPAYADHPCDPEIPNHCDHFEPRPPTVIPTMDPPLRLPQGVPSAVTGALPNAPLPTGYTDVPPTDPFYSPIMYLSDAGVISGYSNNTFQPGNNATRGQISKIIVLGVQLPINTAGGPHFTDVGSSNVFYQFIETLYNAGAISGYADGTFKPFHNVKRGQAAKMIVNAKGWQLVGPRQTFVDVPPSDPFYLYIETAYSHAVISGYNVDGFPLFYPHREITRGQIAKVVFRADPLELTFGHGRPYPGSNNFDVPSMTPCTSTSSSGSPTNPPGTWAGFNDDYGTYTRYIGIGRDILFDGEAKSWLSCRAFNNGERVAMVYHAFNRGGANSGCDDGNYTPHSIRTNLPGPIQYVVEWACFPLLDRSELKVVAGDPAYFVADIPLYFVEAEWRANINAVNNIPHGQLGLDNYLVDSRLVGVNPFKDFMQKYCYTAGSNPLGSRFGVYQCPP